MFYEQTCGVRTGLEQKQNVLKNGVVLKQKTSLRTILNKKCGVRTGLKKNKIDKQTDLHLSRAFRQTRKTQRVRRPQNKKHLIRKKETAAYALASKQTTQTRLKNCGVLTKTSYRKV